MCDGCKKVEVGVVFAAPTDDDPDGYKQVTIAYWACGDAEDDRDAFAAACKSAGYDARMVLEFDEAWGGTR